MCNLFCWLAGAIEGMDHLVKWSLANTTSTVLPLESSTDQKSRKTNSKGLVVLILSSRALSSGSTVLLTTQRLQTFTYCLTSCSISAQKNPCQARCKVLLWPWWPAWSWTPCRMLLTKEEGTMYWWCFFPLSESLHTLYRTLSSSFSFCHCFRVLSNRNDIPALSTATTDASADTSTPQIASSFAVTPTQRIKMFRHFNWFKCFNQGLTYIFMKQRKVRTL